MSWQRNASGETILTNVSGRVCLDSLVETTVTFGIWIISCDSLSGDRRDFSMVTTTSNATSPNPKIKHNRFSHLSIGSVIHLNFDAQRENGNLNIYSTSQEAVNYSVFRFWSNQSYDDPILSEGDYGSSTTTPKILIDSFGRLVDIQNVIITPDWKDVIGKPTTVALSGLVDALSTSSLIDCGVF